MIIIPSLIIPYPNWLILLQHYMCLLKNHKAFFQDCRLFEHPNNSKRNSLGKFIGFRVNFNVKTYASQFFES